LPPGLEIRGNYHLVAELKRGYEVVFSWWQISETGLSI